MGEKRTYWLDLFTYSTWRQFMDAGHAVTGFRETRWRLVKQIKPGDYLLCYLTGVSRWIGLLEATSEGYLDETPVWSEAVFPARVQVRLLVELAPEHGVPVFELKDQLTAFQGLKSPHAWTGHFRGSPTRWKLADGKVVVAALYAAQSNPILRPFDKRKLHKMPPVLRSKAGVVTVPENEPEDETTREDTLAAGHGAPKEPTEHTEFQRRLLKLGNDLGLDVWVAKNDKGREFNGQSLVHLPRLRKDLPLQFDEPTTKTIELIDVLWLRGNAIVAAFEIESRTSIYSGLLRMADLIAMQPNLNIPLYLVAPDERRNKVLAEVNRPTFKRLSPSLSEVCRYIPSSDLRSKLDEVQRFVRYLRPDFSRRNIRILYYSGYVEPADRSFI